MICPNCSNNVDDRYRLCDRCGAEMPPVTGGTDAAAQEAPQYSQPQYSQFRYNQQYNQQYNQPYGQQYNPQYNQPYGYQQGFEEDKPDTALNVLSFFIPILGIVLYFVEKDKKPIKAKAALKWSLISWGVSFALAIVYFIVFFGFAFAVGMGEMYY